MDDCLPQLMEDKKRVVVTICYRWWMSLTHRQSPQVEKFNDAKFDEE